MTCYDLQSLANFLKNVAVKQCDRFSSEMSFVQILLRAVYLINLKTK